MEAEIRRKLFVEAVGAVDTMAGIMNGTLPPTAIPYSERGKNAHRLAVLYFGSVVQEQLEERMSAVEEKLDA